MRRKVILFLLLFLFIVSFSNGGGKIYPVNAQVKYYGLGLKPSPQFGSAINPKVVQSLVSPNSLPSSVDLSYMLPPVGDQGHQGSCTAWATGYYYKTFVEEKENGWDVSVAAHQFSPAFIYNIAHSDGSTDGTSFKEAFDILKNYGCDTLKYFPYDENDSSTQPTTEQLKLALPFKISSYSYIFWGRLVESSDTVPTTNWTWTRNTYTLSDTNIDELKSILYGGNIFVVAIPVFSTWYEYDFGPDDYIHYVPSSGEVKFYGYHAVTIVGYDDGKYGGSFRMVNSWGSDWGDGGFTWITYDWFKQCAEEGWKMDDLSPDFSVKVMQPNGGERIKTGNTYNIVWEPSDAGGGDATFANQADIYYVSDTGVCPVVKNTPDNGNYAWNVPDDVYGRIKVEVDIKDSTGWILAKDVSDDYAVLITPPSAPQSLTATPDDTNKSVTLNWSPSTQGTYPINGYAIYRGTSAGGESDTPIATVDANTTTYTDTDVTNGVTYYYYVKAYDNQSPANYSDSSDEASATPMAKPAVSTNSASDITSTSATLNGNLTDMGGASSVTVYFEWGTDESYGNETTHETMNATGNFSADLTDLSPGTTYHFRAVAENSAGTSYGDDKTFTVSSSASLTIHLKGNKFNLISFPFTVNPSDIPNLVKAYTFDWSKYWQVWTPNGEQDFTTFEPGKGYWIKVSEDEDVTLTGTSTDSSFQITITPNKFNLLGVPFNSPIDISALNSANGNHILKIYSFDWTNYWQLWTPNGEQDFTTFEPGKGYWILFDSTAPTTFTFVLP